MHISCGNVFAKSAMALLFLGAAAMPAKADTVSFPGKITTLDPCTHQSVTVQGTTTLSVTKTRRGVTVREHFMGWNDAYDVFYRGEARFRSASNHYDVPVSGEWEGPKFVFQSKGTDRIDATNNGLKPTGDSLGPLQNRCGENFGN